MWLQLSLVLLLWLLSAVPSEGLVKRSNPCTWEEMRKCSKGLQPLTEIDNGLLSVAVYNYSRLHKICKETWRFESCYLERFNACNQAILSFYQPPLDALSYMCGSDQILSQMRRNIACMNNDAFKMWNLHCYDNYTLSYFSLFSEGSSLLYKVKHECRLIESFLYCHHSAIQASCGTYFTTTMYEISRRLHKPQYGHLCDVFHRVRKMLKLGITVYVDEILEQNSKNSSPQPILFVLSNLFLTVVLLML